jgi:undecaprenyl pyrophosphate synthase
VSARKINNDQKAQVQKIPSLQAQLAQLEEQMAQYKKFDQEYQTRLESEKSALETAHVTEKAALKSAVEEARLVGKNEAKAEENANLLVLTKFLRAAAAKRIEEEMVEEEENKAFEGVLLLVYGGDESAIVAVKKLIEGSDELVVATDGITVLDITCRWILSDSDQKLTLL